ncbi:MAG: D-alanyl-D-alanine carboxypeptidase/D-alanyl-D-alanine-endopeptidase [Bacteroidaceae bacterium]|nr:D-alanyl-D-alanine carboxypeptidase/D-alanyl-D-alanine-endopeptidase [Bacteroidaceae bacterium]
MKRFCLLFVLFLMSLSISYAQQQSVTALRRLLLDSLFEKSQVAISIYDITLDKPLFSYQSKQLYRPASTQKLLTSITALNQLGSHHSFSTTVYYTGELKRNTIKGDLYVVGGFDSEFDTSSMDSLVQKIVRSGVKEVQGTVYGDVSLTDSLYWGPGWIWDDTPGGFQPYMSPLLVDKGCAKLKIIPQKMGEKPLVTIDPISTFYSLRNEAVSKSHGKLKVTRNWLAGGNELIVRGNATHRTTRFVNLYNSQSFFMHLFIEKLQKWGIKINPAASSSRSEKRSGMESYPSTISPLYAFKQCPVEESCQPIASFSHSLKEVLHQALKNSDNLSAEALLCHLGVSEKGTRHISRKDGIQAIFHLMQQLGMDKKNYKIVDGCGLSNYNYLSTELLVKFLRYAYAKPSIFVPLYRSLPIAGVDGTLKYRMGKGYAHCNVRAKTGTMTGVSSLAGYLKDRKGHTIAFAIMNQNMLSVQKVRAFQDKVCEILCATID